MPAVTPWPLGRLPRNAETAFDLEPEAALRGEIALALDLLGLRKLRFRGRLIPEGARDWRLEGELGATVVQPCVVTTEPVTSRIDETVTRRYLSEIPDLESVEDEVEMPEDDSIEVSPETLDPVSVMTEALALALPLYPRAEGADLGAAVFGPPGIAAMTDEDAKPLAGLAALRGKLESPEEPGGEDPD